MSAFNFAIGLLTKSLERALDAGADASVRVLASLANGLALGSLALVSALAWPSVASSLSVVASFFVACYGPADLLVLTYLSALALGAAAVVLLAWFGVWWRFIFHWLPAILDRSLRWTDAQTSGRAV